MDNLSDFEKRFIAIGLILAKDYLSVWAESEEEKHQLIVKTARLVEKLGLDEEFGKACVQTADFANVIKEAAQKVKREASS